MAVRTRIAPSPTGYPHIGTIYQALFNYTYAQKNSGKFVVRIEDTDRERFVADAEIKLYNALDWFRLSEDESPRKDGTFTPYRQSERLETYHKFAKQLIEKDYAYYCFCSKERLDEVRSKLQQEKKTVMYDKNCRNLDQQNILNKLEQKLPFVIRMKIPQNEIIVCKDEIRGDIRFESNTIDDQVILKSDGYPTYHLAVIVDDHFMEISHVVRAEEWLPSFPKHVLLYKFLGWQMPLFYHTPALRNPDKSKLSKRQGHTDVVWYREQGYLPEALLNFLSLLGWSHPDEKEIFSLPEFIKLFDLKDIHPVGPIFDLTKLTWMNQQYIQMKSDEELKKIITEFYPKVNQLSHETIRKIIPLVKTRMETLKDFEEITAVFFEDAALTQLDTQEKQIAEELSGLFEKTSDWNKDTVFSEVKTLLVKYKVRMPFFYKLFTGKERGLPLPETLEILGKQKTLDLLTQTIKA